jgi:hypothetical protein
MSALTAQRETFTWQLSDDALDGSARKVHFIWARGGLVTRFHAMSLLELEAEIEQHENAGLDTKELRRARSKLAKTVRRRRRYI